MPDEADAEKILTAFTLANWRRPLGRPCITEDYSAGPEIEQPLTKWSNLMWLRIVDFRDCRIRIRLALRTFLLNARKEEFLPVLITMFSCAWKTFAIFFHSYSITSVRALTFSTALDFLELRLLVHRANSNSLIVGCFVVFAARSRRVSSPRWSLCSRCAASSSFRLRFRSFSLESFSSSSTLTWSPRWSGCTTHSRHSRASWARFCSAAGVVVRPPTTQLPQITRKPSRRGTAAVGFLIDGRTTHTDDLSNLRLLCVVGSFFTC